MKPDEYVGPASWCDYSQSEWVEIDSAISYKRKHQLSDTERLWLRRVGRALAGKSGTFESRTRPPAAERVKNFAKVARLSTKLEFAIRDAVSSQQFLTDGAFEEELTGLITLKKRAEFLVASNDPNRILKLGPFKVRDLDNRRARYVHEVLNIWERLGGKLAISHNQLGTVSGPLSRYFFAVTMPVLRFVASQERLPGARRSARRRKPSKSIFSLESLPYLIRRQKDYLAKIKEMQLRMQKALERRNHTGQ